MGNLLYLIAVILIILWAIGFFAYSAGAVIHILLVIAIVAILFMPVKPGLEDSNDCFTRYFTVISIGRLVDRFACSHLDVVRPARYR